MDTEINKYGTQHSKKVLTNSLEDTMNQINGEWLPIKDTDLSIMQNTIE